MMPVSRVTFTRNLYCPLMNGSDRFGNIIVDLYRGRRTAIDKLHGTGRFANAEWCQTSTVDFPAKHVPIGAGKGGAPNALKCGSKGHADLCEVWATGSLNFKERSAS
jgi:hypothetical protein